MSEVSAKRPARGAIALVLAAGLALAGGEVFLGHLASLQAVQNEQFAGLQAQLTQLQSELARVQPAPGSIAAQADLSVKFAALAGQVNAVQGQMAADHGALTNLQASAADLAKLTARIGRLNALETARMALDAGAPLGAVPGAPAALTAYAQAAPPTLAQLRLGFPVAAAAAEAASIAGDAKGGYWARVVSRLEAFITISDGDRVIFGPPAAGVVNEARDLLAAGDLAGAVAKLDLLSVPARQAMGGWLAQAHGLLAARAALLALADQA
jgi:hypothetical protein